MQLGIQKAQLKLTSHGNCACMINFLDGEPAYIEIDSLTWRDQSGKHGEGKNSLDKFLQYVKDKEGNLFSLVVLIVSANLKIKGLDRTLVLKDLDIVFL